jgi:tetratricopeptide (TPR) repeat protein
LNRRLLLGITVSALLAAPIPAEAQMLTAEISGLVRAQGTNQPPPGTVVSLRSDAGEAIQQLTPEGNGHFVFQNLRRGIYYVTASALGYREAGERADVLNTPRVSIFLSLTPQERNSSQTSQQPPGTVNQRELLIPEGAQREFEKGRKLLEEKESEKSIAHFRKAIEKYPPYVSAHFLLGVAHMNLKQWKAAEEALRKATELNDKLGPAYLALGACLNFEGNFAAAEKPLLRGLELNPDTADGHYELGKAYWALGRWKDAEPRARKALELRPDFPAAHLLMGNVLLHKQDSAAALREFKEYLRLDPNGPYAPPTREVVAKLEQALGTPR